MSAPLITWGLVDHSRSAERAARRARRQNLGIYRQQVIGRSQVIMRWLPHRGGALDFRDFAIANPDGRFRLPWRWAPTRPRSSAP